MSQKQLGITTVTLDKIVGGGQALGTLDDGRKIFVWNGLPGETVTAQITKKKSHYLEGAAIKIEQASDKRAKPHDPGSYLSTSPWQMMTFEAEQHYKSALIEEAFELHDIVLPGTIDVYTNDVEYGYRNKMEFSWYGHTVNGEDALDLAFFQRGSKGKLIVEGSSLAHPSINQLAIAMRDLLREKPITARDLKTLMIRCDQSGNAVWQLYVKTKDFASFNDIETARLPAAGGEIIYSDPKSPASRISRRLASYGDITLHDTILDVPFQYACEGFFQVNIPVYEQALRDMKEWIDRPIVDLYSGVGTIGLTIGGDQATLVEIDENAVREMRRNIKALGSSADAVLAPSEKALDDITPDKTIVVDPPRAGLHADVVNHLLTVKPHRIIYLSCNPVTQARDVALLAESYGIRHHQGYNFFPRTPHIEHLVVLDLKP